ncbi:MAG: hypothetical protein U0326_34610 [Polyangiales bacterium]
MMTSRASLAVVVAALLALGGCTGTAVVGGYPPNPPTKDAAADADATVTCPSPLSACNGRCVDGRSDRDNCGVCGRACGAGNVCQNGACVPDCAATETLCAGGDGGAPRCASLQTDRENCGACGRACGRDQVCAGGTCTFMCTGTTTECGGASGMDGGADRYCAPAATCRPIDSAAARCGNACSSVSSASPGAASRCRAAAELTACDAVCATSRPTTATAARAGCAAPPGRCAPAGPAPCRAAAGSPTAGTCRDLQTDNNNCGACGTTCPAGQLCSVGRCRSLPKPGTTNCTGICRDLTADPANCGALRLSRVHRVSSAPWSCQVSCVTGTTNCSGVCRDLDTDLNNCGACGMACPSGRVFGRTPRCRASTVSPTAQACAATSPPSATTTAAHAARRASGQLCFLAARARCRGAHQLLGHLPRPHHRPQQLRRLRDRVPVGAGVLRGRVHGLVRDGHDELLGRVPRPHQRSPQLRRVRDGLRVGSDLHRGPLRHLVPRGPG